MKFLMRIARGIDWINGLVGKLAMWLVLAASTVPCCTASTTPNGGTSSPPGWTVIWNLPPDMTLTALANTSAPP
jgi:TRAP-type mannitol/chloroaromatic compound transport system permease small subunit